MFIRRRESTWLTGEAVGKHLNVLSVKRNVVETERCHQTLDASHLLCYSLSSKAGVAGASEFTTSPSGGPVLCDKLQEKQIGDDSVEVAANKAIVQTFGCVLALWKQ